MKIEKDCVVTANFQLYGNEGVLVDSSDQNGPLLYLHGAEDLLPGVEAALHGHGVGDQITVELTPDQAFGAKDESLIDKVPRENFPGVEQISVGMQFQTDVAEGYPVVVRVIAIDDKFVTVDGNHEMADQHLKFELEVTDVREATDEEKVHGHVHSHDGHCEH